MMEPVAKASYPSGRIVKSMDYLGLGYFLILATVSTAAWLNIRMPFDPSPLFSPLLYFVLFTPLYVVAFAGSYAKGFIGRLLAGRTVFKESPGVTKIGSFALLISDFLLFFLFLLICYVGLQFFLAGIIIASDIATPPGLDFTGALLFLLNPADPWQLTSILANCLFHLPRLAWVFENAFRVDDDSGNTEKPAGGGKRRGHGAEYASYVRYLKPVITLLASVVFGVLGFMNVPIWLTWAFIDHAAKKRNTTIDKVPFIDGVLVVLIFLISFFAMLAIMSAFRVAVWNFVPMVIVYALINMKFTYDEAFAPSAGSTAASTK